MTLIDSNDMEYIVTDEELMHRLGYRDRETRFHWTSGLLAGKNVHWGSKQSMADINVNWFRRNQEPNGDGLVKTNVNDWPILT